MALYHHIMTQQTLQYPIIRTDSSAGEAEGSFIVHKPVLS